MEAIIFEEIVVANKRSANVRCTQMTIKQRLERMAGSVEIREKRRLSQDMVSFSYQDPGFFQSHHRRNLSWLERLPGVVTDVRSIIHPDIPWHGSIPGWKERKHRGSPK